MPAPTPMPDPAHRCTFYCCPICHTHMLAPAHEGKVCSGPLLVHMPA